MTEAKNCQTELHKWCKANQVSFDPAKESVHIMSHAQPHGDPFKLLGVTHDCKLDGFVRAGDGKPGLLEADHNPQDKALP